MDLLCSELIRRYREKGQECLSLQEQLRQALGQEASLQQSLVGLKAEVSALMREKQSLQDTMTASQWEKELAEARATNAEVCVCVCVCVCVSVVTCSLGSWWCSS